MILKSGEEVKECDMKINNAKTIVMRNNGNEIMSVEINKGK